VISPACWFVAIASKPTEDNESLLAWVGLLLIDGVAVDVDAVGREAQQTKGAQVGEPPCPAQHTSSLLLLGERVAGTGHTRHAGHSVLLSVTPALLSDGLALVARSIERVARHRGESSLLDKLTARGGESSGKRLHGH
jgi:hypothetical protein